jgi:hypothetical protein
VRDHIPLGILLRAKGVFISRPHCYCKKGLVGSIRVGHFLCLNDGCRREIMWTARDNTEIHVDSLRARANLYQDSLVSERRPMNMGKYSLDSRYRRAFTQPTIKHRCKWDAKLTSKDGLGLTHGLAWCAAGGTWDYPRPYQLCPWNSDATEYPGYRWGDLFPPTFPLRLRQFMRAPERWVFQIHSVGYYDAVWKGMCNSIERDPDLIRDPKIQAYVKNVISGGSKIRRPSMTQIHS